MFLIKEKTKIQSVNVDDAERQLILSLRSIGKEYIEWLKDFELLQKMFSKKGNYEFTQIVNYINVFGFKKYLNILNDTNTFESLFDNEIIETQIFPVHCNDEREYLWDKRKSVFSDYKKYTEGKGSFEVKLVREPDNPYDENAIAIYAGDKTKHHIGYLNRHFAKELSPKLDMGMTFIAKITNIKYYQKNNSSSPLYLTIYYLEE